MAVSRYNTRQLQLETSRLRYLCAFISPSGLTVLWVTLLALSAPLIVNQFQASGETAELITLFCRWLSPLFFFLGALFISNAVFNTLGRPHVSTALNWARATLGTVPFVLAGEAVAGAPGVITGQMLGGVAFGIIAVALAHRLIDVIGDGSTTAPPANGRVNATVDGILGLSPATTQAGAGK